MSTSRSVVHHLSPSVDGAYCDMKAVIKSGDELVRCYFADNDLIAAGAMRALSEAGYRIPEDISVIGFDDMPMCTYITPPLSTVHVPKQYMGEIAVKRLAEIINSTSASHVKIEISTEIIKRKSFSAKPMMVEEAILQMNMLGHTFFIFTNPDTMSPNIVYKRKDGNYALIEMDE